MHLHSNLFIKVFVAFWLVTMAVLGSWLVTTDYFDSQPPRPSVKETRQPHRIMLRLIYNMENLSESALARSLDAAAENYNIEIYLVNRHGKDMFGKEVPYPVKRIITALKRDRRKPYITFHREQLAAYRVRREDEGLMTAVFVFPEERQVIIDTLGSNLWLRIALAVLISGLICYGLSRLVTNRIRDLQLASRRIADGDLDTRLEVRNVGGDETDELARDFNSMAEQLQQRIQAQKRLLGDVSHELRSPLARLRLSLALAQEKPDNRQAYMARIEQETERLEELISQLLSSQQHDLARETPVDLVKLLEQLCSDGNFEGEAQGKTIFLETGQHDAVVHSHSDSLRKCFENILRNALHHTADRTRVSVTLSASGDNYRISVEDQGPGVSEEELERIFDEFYRSDSARTRESGGAGLGLAIARRSVEQHGGTITARNSGTGLQIIVELPRTAPEGA